MDKVVHPFRWSTPDYDQDQPIPVRFILMTGDQCKAACQLPDIMPGRGILGGNLFALMVAGSTRPNRAGYGTTAYFLGFTDYLDYTGLLASRLGRPGLPQQVSSPSNQTCLNGKALQNLSPCCSTPAFPNVERPLHPSLCCIILGQNSAESHSS